MKSAGSAVVLSATRGDMLLHVLCIKQEKRNSCWHAAARMLYGYKRRQCIDPLPNTYQANAGLRAENFITLARSVGYVFGCYFSRARARSVRPNLGCRPVVWAQSYCRGGGC